jgi:hypothetical protein
MDMIHCHLRLSLDITGLPVASIYLRTGESSVVSSKGLTRDSWECKGRQNDISKLTLAHAFFVGKGELVTQRCHVGSRRCE